MSKKLARGLVIALAVIIILALLLGGCGILTVRRSFPKTRGTVSLPGLDATVEVYRDSFGVPHIYASTEHDLFMAQGYVHAQDRFWQMDFWRHIGAGRLAEMFGESQLETDMFLRTMGWARVAQQEYESFDQATRANLEAYAEGVNAYLTEHQGSSLSLEYAILGLLNPDYQPEPWTPVQSLTWGKVMAWDLGSNMSSEMQRATLLTKIGPERTDELWPDYPSDHPVIVPPQVGQASPDDHSYAATPAYLAWLPDLESLRQRMASLHELTGGGFQGIGSNNWVIAGERTATGGPLLANDMHLGIQMPSIWYEIGLHCYPVSDACPIEVVGFSFAGIPAVIVGHNANIAWGVTNLGPDVQDLYIEKINPDNPNQYEVNGEWVDMTIVEETIEVSDAEAQALTIRYTRHGPILSDVDEDMAAWAASLAEGGPTPLALSLRWTALDPGTIVHSVLMLNAASNWDEFRQALRYWDVPSQNFVFADIQGNIGYQSPGRIPIRASGDGTLPVPGWTDEYEWTGFIPFEELPSVFNPAQGYLATANHAVVGPDYPYLITTQWDYGYRASRIVAMIEQDAELSIEDIQRIHGDNYNAMGPLLTPLLQELEFEETEIGDLVALLEGWDYQNDMDSASAALFNAFWHHLVLRTFGDDLPEGWSPGGSQAFLVISALLDQPYNPWWDDLGTGTMESRDDILLLAFTDAVAELEALLGEDPADWSWGDLHTATFENATLGTCGIGPIESLFNRGPFPTAGGSSIVNATGWSFESGYQVTSVPSERLIVDLTDFDNTLSIHPTGQSGHAYHPNYIDMADMWRTIQYHPLLWSRDRVVQASEALLELVP
ncbi:MAG: penicillin acylase family protein [Anaerolineales bacterium]|jgi:penicillin amidase